MKKLIKSIMMAALILAGTSAFAASKKSIVCTTYPQYDWIINILGENKSFEVTLLQDKGTDLHSFQPGFKEIAKISDCDMFVYVGGESDEWVEDALSNARNKDMVVVNMMEVLGDSVREEEVIEGMQCDVEEEHHHEDEHHHDDEDETHGHHHDEAPEYDEHVWLSVRNAKIIVNALAQNISKLDAKNEAKYAANAAAYTKQLATLDAEFVDVVNASNKKVVLFGDRFPFRYLVDDYGIKYYAAFVGCSAETEASFETVSFLSEKVNELGLNVVLTIEKSNQKIAKTIIRNSKNKNCKIMEMDSLQSVTKKDIKKGISYLGVMKDNLKVLKEALK